MHKQRIIQEAIETVLQGAQLSCVARATFPNAEDTGWTVETRPETGVNIEYTVDTQAVDWDGN